MARCSGRWWAAWLGLVGASFAAVAGAAELPPGVQPVPDNAAPTSKPAAVRLGIVDIKPYILLQFDEGVTLDKTLRSGLVTGFDPRRARAGFQAEIGRDWQFGFIWDFGGTPGSPMRLVEASATYSGLKPFSFTSGVLKPSFTLEYSQSSADILFLERPSIINIIGGLVGGDGRVVLGQAAASGERWFASALVTGGTTGPGAQSDKRALLARAAGLPVKLGDLALHLGVSGAYIYEPHDQPGRGTTLSFGDRPELRYDITDNTVSTGALRTPGGTIEGVEAGFGWGRLWAQSEYYRLGVDRTAANRSDYSFSGWYAQAAYTLVGQPRRWKPSTAAWGSPKPSAAFDPAHGEWGAFEVGGRVSSVDLNSGPVHGGRQRVWTTGVSWYPTEPLRFMLEFAHADIAGGRNPGSLDAIALRGQLKF